MSPDVPFRHFHEQLAALNRRLLAMSEKAEALIELSVDATHRASSKQRDSEIGQRSRSLRGVRMRCLHRLAEHGDRTIEIGLHLTAFESVDQCDA